PIEEQTAAGLRIAVGEGALSAAVTGLLPERGYRGVLRTAATTSEFTFRTCRPIDKRRSAGCFLQTGETGSGSVIAAAGSRLVAGWRHETDGSKKLRFAESLDGGLTWSPPHPLAPDGPPDCPVALGSDGTTFAAAIGVVQGGPAQMWVRFSSAARTGWSTPVTLESGLHDPALASAGGGRFDLLAWGAWLPGVEPSVRWHGISTSGGALSTGRRAFVLSHRHSGVTCAYLTHSGRRLCVFAIDEDRSGRRWANWTSTDDPENGEWAPWRPLIEPGEGLSSDLGVACGDGILCVGYALGGVVKVCVSQDDGRTFRTLAGPVHEKLLDWEPAVAIWKKQVFLGAHCLSPADPNGPTILVFYRSADLVSWESVGRLALPLIEPKDMRFAVSEDRIVAVVADHHAGLASFTLPIKPASSSQ
ncbi:MAG: hypothetical protein HY303_13230, partial [Candidatus Wallbacteria bacterium]|nr:hypothetical protein [Candidatus Wallbacteria bacterium]